MLQQRKQRNSRTPLNVGGKNSSTISSMGKSIAQILESLDIDDGGINSCMTISLRSCMYLLLI